MKIDVENVDFSYPGGKKVLHDISFTLSEPGLVCIIGPNGVGKSTLIRCINKISKVSSGRVLVDGEDIKGLSYKKLAEHMGYVPVTSADDFPMTVFDTIMIGRSPKSGFNPGKKDYEIVYDVMEMVGIEDLAMCAFNELSAGQHQKVAIARGLAQEPELLILDEPTSNLDVKHQITIIKLLHRLSREKNMTSLMISHDLNIASRYADRIILMSEPGVIKQIGTPVEVITQENMESVYGVKCMVQSVEGRPHVIILDAI